MTVVDVSGRRRPEREVGVDRRGQSDVPAGLLGQEPLLLEDVAVGLDEVAVAGRPARPIRASVGR